MKTAKLGSIFALSFLLFGNACDEKKESPPDLKLRLEVEFTNKKPFKECFAPNKFPRYVITSEEAWVLVLRDYQLVHSIDVKSAGTHDIGYTPVDASTQICIFARPHRANDGRDIDRQMLDHCFASTAAECKCCYACVNCGKVGSGSGIYDRECCPPPPHQR
jgi:hypothetical protein